MTDAPRPTPFDLVFGQVAVDRFPVIRAGIVAAGRDPRDRDGFALVREVVEFLHELRPDEGLGKSVDGLVALVHRAYLFWLDGERIIPVNEAGLARLLANPGPAASTSPGSSTRYVQMPPLRVWGTPIAGQSVEPLDGWFVERHESSLGALAVFGLHPGREGLTAVEVEGARPEGFAREDGTALFSPLLAGGEAAGLLEVSGEAELLELVWRMEAI